MPTSFRLRIAGLASALAGSALIGFAGVAWQLIYVAKVNQLDAQLEKTVQSLGRPRPPESWPASADMILQQLGAAPEKPVALQILDDSGQIWYQSDSWPQGLSVQSLLPPPSSPPQGMNPRDNAHHRNQRDRFSEPPFSPSNGREPGRFLEPPPVVMSTQKVGATRWRMATARFPRGQVGAIAIPLATLYQDMRPITTTFVLVIPITLVLVALGAWWLAGKALQPIQRLTVAMQQVTAKGLDQRVSASATDAEFVALINVFNQMLDRLGRSFKQAQRFSGDAAHELKTPLAILQGELEQAIANAEPASPSQQQLGDLLEEVSHLSSIVRKLLLLSLADAGQLNIPRIRVNMSELLLPLVEDIELIAPDLQVQSDIAPDLVVLGDPDLLNQVLQNLISNAVKYNAPQGWIRLQAQRQAQQIQIKIANATEGLLPEDCDRIFDRFYRGDPSRNRKIEGLGLGLNLAREIVHAHQGDLRLAKASAGEVEMVLTLVFNPGS
jgi:two-component system, OmpR family, heavy metal sensor histidine kinase CusS